MNEYEAHIYNELGLIEVYRGNTLRDVVKRASVYETTEVFYYKLKLVNGVLQSTPVICG